MQYSFGEIRKAAVAVITLVATGISALLANTYIASVLPPQWVLVGGAIVTVLGVFGISNDPAPKTVSAVESAEQVVEVLKETVAERVPNPVRDQLGPIVGEVQSRIDRVTALINKYRR